MLTAPDRCPAAEREEIEARLAAVDRFETRVRRVEPVSPTGGTATPVPDGGTTAALGSSGSTDRCDRVREAFAETVGETVDEPTPAAMRGELTEEITAWLSSADGTPLLGLDFEGLRARHERLAAFREQCDRLARKRQSLLTRTVSEGGAAGVDHRSLVESLYGGLPTAHPVLSAAVTLEEVCTDCQKAVRDHLTRRV